MRKLLSGMLTFVVAGAVLTGCAGQQAASSDMGDIESKLSAKERELAELRNSMSAMERDAERREAEIREARARAEALESGMNSSGGTTTTTTTASSDGGFINPELLPPNAKAGECYARVFIPPTFKTEKVEVLRKEAGEKLSIIPAKYEWATEKVLVKEATSRLEVVPATYKWVEEKVLVKPESKKIVEVPEVWETETEKVLERPAHQVWKKGRGPVERIDEGTGEIMCLIEVPATYKTVTRRVLKSPATTREVVIPAEYTTVKKRVVDREATTRKVEIPAEYKTVKVRQIVQEPKVNRTPVPAIYDTVTKRVKVTEGRMDWRPVLCETNMSGVHVTEIQRALQRAGYNPGKIDGVIGSQTKYAIKQFQQAKGLATGGLTMETIRALGVRVG